MSKSRYHCVECKRVDWDGLAAQAAGQPLVFGVDVAKFDFVAALQTQDGTALVRVKWQHPEETGALLTGLKRLGAGSPLAAAGGRHGIERHLRGCVALAVTSTGGDGVPGQRQACPRLGRGV